MQSSNSLFLLIGWPCYLTVFFVRVQKYYSVDCLNRILISVVCHESEPNVKDETAHFALVHSLVILWSSLYCLSCGQFWEVTNKVQND